MTITNFIVTGRGDRKTVEAYLYNGNAIAEWTEKDGNFVAVITNDNDRAEYQKGRFNSGLFGCFDNDEENYTFALQRVLGLPDADLPLLTEVKRLRDAGRLEIISVKA